MSRLNELDRESLGRALLSVGHRSARLVLTLTSRSVKGSSIGVHSRENLVFGLMFGLVFGLVFGLGLGLALANPPITNPAVSSLPPWRAPSRFAREGRAKYILMDVFGPSLPSQARPRRIWPVVQGVELTDA